MSALIKEQVSEHYRAVEEGITKLYAQSEADGLNVAINPEQSDGPL